MNFDTESSSDSDSSVEFDLETLPEGPGGEGRALPPRPGAALGHHRPVQRYDLGGDSESESQEDQGQEQESGSDATDDVSLDMDEDEETSSPMPPSDAPGGHPIPAAVEEDIEEYGDDKMIEEEEEEFGSGTGTAHTRPATSGGVGLFNDDEETFAEQARRPFNRREGDIYSTGSASEAADEEDGGPALPEGIVSADEWDALLDERNEGILCLDRGPLRQLYHHHDDTAAMLVKVLTPPVAVHSPADAQWSRVSACAKARVEAFSASDIAAASLQDSEKLAEEIAAAGSAEVEPEQRTSLNVWLHAYENASVDSRGRIIAQASPLPSGYRSLLELVALARHGATERGAGALRTVGGPFLPSEVAAMTRLLATFVCTRLHGSTVVDQRAYGAHSVGASTEAAVLTHGNLAASNVFIRLSEDYPEGDAAQGLSVVLTDPLEGFTCPQEPTDCSHYSPAHLKYLQSAITDAAAEANNSSATTVSTTPGHVRFSESLFLRCEERPYVPTEKDDVAAIGAIAFLFLFGCPLRHGLRAVDAALVQSDDHLNILAGGDAESDDDDEKDAFPISSSAVEDSDRALDAGYLRLKQSFAALFHQEVQRRRWLARPGSKTSHTGLGEMTTVPQYQAFLTDALDFVYRATLCPESSALSLSSLRAVLGHAFVSGAQGTTSGAAGTGTLAGDAAVVKRLVVDAASSAHTLTMLAGSGPIRNRFAHNSIFNRRTAALAAATAHLSALLPAATASVPSASTAALPALQRIVALLPCWRSILVDFAVTGTLPPLPDVLALLLPGPAVTVDAGAAALVIDGASGLRYTFTEKDAVAVALTVRLHWHLSAILQNSLGEQAAAEAALARWCESLFNTSGVCAAAFPAVVRSVIVRHCHDCAIAVLLPLEHVTVANVTQSRLHFGPAITAVIANVEGCVPIALAAQTLFLEEDIVESVLSFHLCHDPKCLTIDMTSAYERVMEMTKQQGGKGTSAHTTAAEEDAQPTVQIISGDARLQSVRFIPYVVAYPGLCRHVEQIKMVWESAHSILSYPQVDVLTEREILDFTDLSGPAVCRGGAACLFGTAEAALAWAAGPTAPLAGTDIPDGPLADTCRRLLGAPGRPLRYSDWVLPCVGPLAAGGAAVPLVCEAADYPYHPAIFGGLALRHENCSQDLVVLCGEASGVDIVITNVHGDPDAEDTMPRSTPALSAALPSPRPHLLAALTAPVGFESSVLQSPFASGSGAEPSAAGSALLDASTTLRAAPRCPSLFILEAVGAVAISDVSRCTIVVAASAATVTLTNVRHCKVYAIARSDIVLHGCSSVEIHGYTSHGSLLLDPASSRPRGLGPCERLQLMPLLLCAPLLDDVLLSSGIGERQPKEADEADSAAEDEDEEGPVCIGPNRFLSSAVREAAAGAKDVHLVERATCAFVVEVPSFPDPCELMLQAEGRKRLPQLPLAPYVNLNQHTGSSIGSAGPTDVCIHSLFNPSVLRMPGGLSPIAYTLKVDAFRRSEAGAGNTVADPPVAAVAAGDTHLTIANCHGGILHITEPVEVLYVADCTGPIDLIVVAAQRVIVERCANITLQTACFEFFASDCHHCHFALHVNSQPRIDDGFNYWAAGGDSRPGGSPPTPAALAEGLLSGLGSARPCTYLEFSPLNVTCDHIETIMETACVQPSPNLYDQAVLIRLPPPSGPQSSLCGGSKRNPLLLDAMTADDDGQQSPLALPAAAVTALGERTTVAGGALRQLREAVMGIAASMPAAQWSALSQVLSPLFAVEPSGAEATRASGTVRFAEVTIDDSGSPVANRGEDPARRSATPQPLQVTEPLRLSGFESGLVISCALQATAVGASAETPPWDVLQSRVDEDTQTRFAHLTHLISQLRWALETRPFARRPSDAAVVAAATAQQTSPTNTITFTAAQGGYPFGAVSMKIRELLQTAAAEEPLTELRRLLALLAGQHVPTSVGGVGDAAWGAMRRVPVAAAAAAAISESVALPSPILAPEGRDRSAPATTPPTQQSRRISPAADDSSDDERDHARDHAHERDHGHGGRYGDGSGSEGSAPADSPTSDPLELPGTAPSTSTEADDSPPPAAAAAGRMMPPPHEDSTSSDESEDEGDRGGFVGAAEVVDDSNLKASPTGLVGSLGKAPSTESSSTEDDVDEEAPVRADAEPQTSLSRPQRRSESIDTEPSSGESDGEEDMFDALPMDGHVSQPSGQLSPPRSKAVHVDACGGFDSSEEDAPTEDESPRPVSHNVGAAAAATTLAKTGGFDSDDDAEAGEKSPLRSAASPTRGTASATSAAVAAMGIQFTAGSRLRQRIVTAPAAAADEGDAPTDGTTAAGGVLMSLRRGRAPETTPSEQAALMTDTREAASHTPEKEEEVVTAKDLDDDPRALPALPEVVLDTASPPRCEDSPDELLATSPSPAHVTNSTTEEEEVNAPVEEAAAPEMSPAKSPAQPTSHVIDGNATPSITSAAVEQSATTCAIPWAALEGTVDAGPMRKTHESLASRAAALSLRHEVLKARLEAALGGSKTHNGR